MVEGNIYVRCPGCGKAQSVAMAVGQQLQCGVCQTVFFAPVLSEDQLPAATAQEPMSPTFPGTASRPSAASPTAGDAPERTAISETRQVERGSGSKSWRTDGIELGVENVPVPCVAPRTVAGRGLSAAATPDELDEQPAGDGRIWTVITVVASLLVVVATSLVGIYFTRKWRQAADARAANPRPAAAASSLDPSQIRWTDAAQRAQRLGRLELKVVRVKYGAVRAKDLNNDVITTDDSNLLAVTVSVHNRSEQPNAFRSWYAGGLTDDAGEELLPELADDAGRAYDLLRFDDVSSIEGQRLADTIEPRHDVRDTVVFLIPADVDRTKIRYFHLTLPAHAIGSADFFRFEIPVSMIIDF